MPKFAPVDWKTLECIFLKAGFRFARQESSHRSYVKDGVGVGVPASRIDFLAAKWNKPSVKASKRTKERKSWGTLVVEKYRPRMNKLSRKEREQLLDLAMKMAYGDSSASAADRRR